MTSTSARRWYAHPVLVFGVVWAVILGIIFAPLLAGGVIMNPMSDGKDGYVTRHFAAEVIRQWGEVPRWNPYIFGGLPFLGAMHGDQVYPFSVALRAIFSPALGIGLGMVLHLWLGAVGLLVFLRTQRLTWTAAVAGATAYGIGGPFIGLFYPGHDGKIYVLGLLPWGLIAITQATRTLRPLWFALWGAIVGLMLLSPHFQMTYYASMLMGAFLILCLVTETAKSARWKVLVMMAVASVFAIALAGAQLMPFAEYLPFSPRSAAGGTSTGWEFATSWAMSGIEMIGSLWGGFDGWHSTYWGPNPFKLHSDYLGLLTGVLAVTALLTVPKGGDRTRVWFWSGAVVFGALWSLAAHTPFYRIPYTLLPGISKTRAASMMWGQVSMCVAVLAAYGVGQLEAMGAEARVRFAKRAGLVVGIGAAFFVLSAGNLLPALADSARQGAAFEAVYGARVGLLLGAGTVLAFLIIAARQPRWLALAAAVLLLADLGTQGRRFVVIEPRGDEYFAADPAVVAMQADAKETTQPWRVLPFGRAFSDDYLIEHRIRNVLGYHGNEPHHYDELLGGKGQWSNLSDQRTWRLLGVRYLVVDQAIEAPGFVPIAQNVRTWLGEPAWVYRVPNPTPWAWVAPVAVKVPDEAQLVQLVTKAPSFSPDRLVLVSGDAPFGSTVPPTAMPEPLAAQPEIRVTEGAPGDYTLAITGLAQAGVLVVSENWMPWWTATVDGTAAPVARANGAFLGLEVPAGAREVRLHLDSRGDARGLQASFFGAGALLLLALSGLLARRGPSGAAASEATA